VSHPVPLPAQQQTGIPPSHGLCLVFEGPVWSQLAPPSDINWDWDWLVFSETQNNWTEPLLTG
jgi:hypothetical protein